MIAPYQIEGPALISFSGGRTSAYLLKHILDACGGALPANVIACFANTGKEMPETLDFVGDCRDVAAIRLSRLRTVPPRSGACTESIPGKRRARAFLTSQAGRGFTAEAEPTRAPPVGRLYR